MDNKIILYLAVFVVVIVMAWSITTMASNKSPDPAKYQYYQNLQQQSSTGCGDLNDNGNIQHLSHHPDQYKECIKQVDPAKFKEAVGEDRESFLKSKGL